MKKVLFSCLLAAAAAPAPASPWIDDKGRSTSMNFPGAEQPRLAPNGHSLADGAQAFKNICLPGAFDKASIGKAADAAGWRFTYRAQMMPFKNPVDIGGWESADAALNAAEGLFFNKLPQCNLTFVPATPATMPDLVAAVTAAVGSEPHNAAKALDKKGKPNRRFEPEWRLSQPDGSSLLVFARPSPTFAGAVHLAALKKASK